MTGFLFTIREKVVEILKSNNLFEFKRFIQENTIQLTALNSHDFDILITAIENDVTLELIDFIRIHGKYENLNYAIFDNVKIKTPLSSTFERNNFKIAELLIAYGADINYIPYDSLKPILDIKTSNYILNKGLRISDLLINNLIKDHQNVFLQCYFKYNIFDNNFILNLLSLSKNKTVLSNSQLTSVILREKNKMVPNFLYAIQMQNKIIVQYLIECGIDINNINLNIDMDFAKQIIRLNILDILPILSNNHFDMNQKDERGNSILTHALFYESKLIIKYLIDNGANINEEDEDGKTPLTLAIEDNDKEMVEYLLEICGADIENIDGNGYSPLTMAVKFEDLDMVEYLVDNGANVDKKDGNNNTPLEIAFENEKDTIEYSYSMLNYLIDCGADISGDDYSNLFYAVIKGDTDMVIDLFINCDIVDKLTVDDHHHLYVIAIKNDDENMIETLDVYDYEYNILFWNHYYGSYGTSLLNIAIEYSSVNMIKCLADYGAEVNISDHSTNSNLIYAIKIHDSEKVKFLIDNWGCCSFNFYGFAFDINEEYNFNLDKDHSTYYEIKTILNNYVESYNFELNTYDFEIG